MYCLKSVISSNLTGCSEPKVFADYSLSDPLSHFADEEDKARIKSSEMRQSLTPFSLAARRLINALFGLTIFCLTSRVRRAGY